MVQCEFPLGAAVCLDQCCPQALPRL